MFPASITTEWRPESDARYCCPEESEAELDRPRDKERSAWDSQPAPFLILFMWELVSNLIHVSSYLVLKMLLLK